jgi:anaerobic selenocysteine-containing dehydrogenase
MIIQSKKNGALYVYIPKADALEMDIKKGDRVKTCLLDGVLSIRKRVVKNESI